MIQLIVNADDLGLHPRIDAGILRAHREGIVTSATVLVQGRSAQDAVWRAQAQGLRLGVHLCLSTRLVPAAPQDQVRSLAADGRFPATWVGQGWAWARGRIRLAEVQVELEAQLRRCGELGFVPDHLDGHQHLHLLPGVAPIVNALAEARGIPVRAPDERQWLALSSPLGQLKSALLSRLGQDAPFTRRVSAVGLADAGRLTEARLLRVLERLTDGVHELGCHPGYAPEQVPEDPRWRYGWEQELETLCSPRVRAQLDVRGIRLASYAEVQATPGR